MQHPNATMATSSLDRISSSGVFQPYNNFRVQTLGGNIIQGQVNKIRVAEIMFPYDTPTVVYGQNDTIVIGVLIIDGATGVTDLSAAGISVPPQFYTAAELQTALAAGFAADPKLADLTVDVDPVTNALYFVNTGAFANPGTNYVYLIFPTAASVAGLNANTVYSSPSLLWTAGFRNAYAQAGYAPVANAPLPVAPLALVPSAYPNAAPYPVFSAGHYFPAVVGAPYNGRYTDWIDICSPTLCQAQYVRDGNTNQNVIRRDLICRLYIANEISTYQTEPTGDRPFVIHRQFKNAKVMKWTADRSIDSIDIQLFDQYGLPLPSAPPILIAALDANVAAALGNAYSGSRDFGISFLVDEPGAGEQGENVGYRY